MKANDGLPSPSHVGRVLGVSGSEDDAVRVPSLVKAAGGNAMFGGAFGVVLALQTFIFVRHAAVYLGVAALFFVAGAGAIVFGWRIIRVRRGAARMALGACSLLGFISLAWFGYALVHGFFSPLCPVVALDAVAGAVLCGVAVAPLERVVKARAELFGADIA